MTEAEHRAELRALAEQATWTGHWYYAGCGTVHCTYGKSDTEHDEIAHPCPVGVAEYIAAANPSAVLALLDLIAELEQQLVAEAAKTAAEKLRADQMTEQHRMQAAMHAQATERPLQCLHGISEPSGWRPIETAPKNGQCLVWCETDDGGEVMKLQRDVRGNWIYEGEPTYCHSFYINPTRWMPLPPSPSSADEGGSNG